MPPGHRWWRPPNQPEYPAAHRCLYAATSAVLRAFYGTPNVSFDMSSTVTGTTRRYTRTAELVDDIQIARIAGSMHFRKSTVNDAALGASVADRVLTHHFQPC